MDDHHQHHPYGVADFRQLMTDGPPPPDLFPSHHRSPQSVELMMMAAGNQLKVHGHGVGAGLHEFPGNTSGSSLGLEGGDGGSARWPRQETLTLLEIRSRLDSRFREANQKGPLWDEVSRIMYEEHGYHRSGKKCREKFENLYKYYKKTKEGKAGRQDGKHYRFFRQLEALYGDRASGNAPTACSVPEARAMVYSLGPYHPSTISPVHLTNPSDNSKHEAASQPQRAVSDSLSLSGSSDFDTSSSNDDDNSGATDPMVENTSAGLNTRVKKRRGGRKWKAKIKEFIDSRMRKLMEKQEAWVEKMMRALEEKEQERLLRGEEWRRQEIARIDKEHKFWAKERAWIEARDAALMEALHNLTSRPSSDHHMMSMDNHHVPGTNMANADGGGDTVVVDGSMKKSKDYYDKKRKENVSRCSSNNYFQGDHDDSLHNQRGVSYCEMTDGRMGTARVHQLNDGFPPSNSNVGNTMQDSCFRFLMGDGESLWENYGVKLNKGEN